MKKLLFILALLVLFSCQKEEAVFCWTCRVTKTTTGSGATYSIGSTESRCNMSTREMELFEQGSSSGNTITRATCTKQ